MSKSKELSINDNVKDRIFTIRGMQVRVFDPCCGSGGMFVQSEKFVGGHQGKDFRLQI